MKLIDSNLLIYSFQGQYTYLRPLITDRANYVSAISRLEVSGFHGLTDNERQYFELVFTVLTSLPVDDAVINTAIRLRQHYKMKSNDSLIAATGLIYDLPVYTRNTADFDRINGLSVVNPIL